MQNHTQLPTGLSFSYETERLILRLPSTDYLREIHDFLYRNRSCFEKYEPTAPENYYTLDFQQTLARCELKLALKLSSVRFYVFLKEDPSTIIGTVCLHNIIKMPYFTSEVGINSMRLISIMDMPEKLCLWHCLSAFMVSDSTKSLPAACLKIRLPETCCMPQVFSRKELSATVFSFRENGKITSATLS